VFSSLFFFPLTQKFTAIHCRGAQGRMFMCLYLGLMKNSRLQNRTLSSVRG
jgi:hypothetical protein